MANLGILANFKPLDFREFIRDGDGNTQCGMIYSEKSNLSSKSKQAVNHWNPIPSQVKLKLISLINSVVFIWEWGIDPYFLWNLVWHDISPVDIDKFSGVAVTWWNDLFLRSLACSHPKMYFLIDCSLVLFQQDLGVVGLHSEYYW